MQCVKFMISMCYNFVISIIGLYGVYLEILGDCIYCWDVYFFFVCDYFFCFFRYINIIYVLYFILLKLNDMFSCYVIDMYI